MVWCPILQSHLVDEILWMVFRGRHPVCNQPALVLPLLLFVGHYPSWNNSTHMHTHTHTHTHTQLFFSSLDSVWDNPGEPVPEETFTHSHLSWSSVIPYLLPPSIMIHGILPVQFTCLTAWNNSINQKTVISKFGENLSTLCPVFYCK